MARSNSKFTRSSNGTPKPHFFPKTRVEPEAPNAESVGFIHYKASYKGSGSARLFSSPFAKSMNDSSLPGDSPRLYGGLNFSSMELPEAVIHKDLPAATSNYNACDYVAEATFVIRSINYPSLSLDRTQNWEITKDPVLLLKQALRNNKLLGRESEAQRTANNSLSKQNSSLLDDNKYFRDENIHLWSDIKVLEDENKKLREENEYLRQTLAAASAALKAIKDENKKLGDENESLRQALAAVSPSPVPADGTPKPVDPPQAREPAAASEVKQRSRFKIAAAALVTLATTTAAGLYSKAKQRSGFRIAAAALVTLATATAAGLYYKAATTPDKPNLVVTCAADSGPDGRDNVSKSWVTPTSAAKFGPNCKANGSAITGVYSKGDDAQLNIQRTGQNIWTVTEIHGRPVFMTPAKAAAPSPGS